MKLIVLGSGTLLQLERAVTFISRFNLDISVAGYIAC